jgi:hypothetical protein
VRFYVGIREDTAITKRWDQDFFYLPERQGKEFIYKPLEKGAHRRTYGTWGKLPPPPPPPTSYNFGKPWKFGQILGKIRKIRADLSENMLNSGYLITILHKNSGNLSTAPTPPESISPVRL